MQFKTLFFSINLGQKKIFESRAEFFVDSAVETKLQKFANLAMNTIRYAINLNRFQLKLLKMKHT